MPRLLRFYLSVATLLLILITSLGIFGFLSDAYNGTRNKISYLDTKIANIELENKTLTDRITSRKQTQSSNTLDNNNRLERYKSIYDDFVKQQNKEKLELVERRAQLDTQLDALESKPNGLFSNNKKLIEQLKSDQASERREILVKLDGIDTAIDVEYKQFIAKVDQSNVVDSSVFDVSDLIVKVDNNNNQILELKRQVSETDIGSFRFIANAFGVEVDTAVRMFIVMIVVVFDPLAMCLIIGYNVYVHGSARPAVNHNVIPTIMSTNRRVVISKKK